MATDMIARAMAASALAGESGNSTPSGDGSSGSWKLVATFTTDDLGAKSCDLTGCSQLYIRGIGRQTGTYGYCVAATASSGRSLDLSETVITKTYYDFCGMWRDNEFGIYPIFLVNGQSTVTEFDKLSIVSHPVAGYAQLNTKISDIVSFYISGLGNVTSCNIEVWAK